MLKIKNGKLVGSDITDENIYIENGKIINITKDDIKADEVIDAKGNYVSAGFIDTHVHGGGNCDFMDGGVEPMITAAKTHLSHGTTTICPTTLTSSYNTLKNTVLDYKELSLSSGKNGLPNFAGMHLEGPFLAPGQAGAQPPQYIYPPKASEYEELISLGEGLISKWTFAPELEGSEIFCDYLSAHNVVPCIGHTEAEYDQVVRAYEHGAKCLTHFYSSMSTITRRGGYRILGVVEAGYMLEGLSVEVIADGCHLPPELLKMIYKFCTSDRILLVTDAMRGADMPEGESLLGRIGEGHVCYIEDGIAKMPDRTCFAGSVATTDRLVRTMVTKAGCSLTEAVKMMTKRPAELLGLKTKGELKIGYDADIVMFDNNINVKAVMVNGTTIKNNL